MVAPLRRVGVRRPGAMLSADHERWHYARPLDAVAVLAEHDRFTSLLAMAGVDVVAFDDCLDDDPDDDLADSVFTYDPSLVTPAGAVLLAPGKMPRRGEVALHERFYAAQGIPIVGRIEAPGTFEAGDSFWVDDRTLAVGRGFRSNDDGIRQLRAILDEQGIDVVAFDLPWYLGPAACLHLMSLVSALDHDLALVHLPLLPVAFHRLLVDRGFRLVAAPPEEFEPSGGLNLNVLAVGPRRCIAVDGSPGTHAAMRDAGCEVSVFDGRSLAIPCEGGPTCMTRPLLRA